MRVMLTGVLFVASLLFAHAALPQSSQGDEATPRQFGGTYDLLEPGQRRLVDDWVRRFNEVVGRTVPPDVIYNLARLSTRTTFDAVSHALITTELTDASGQSLGTALDLVDQLETIKGKVKGAGGDQQFRIYVVLKPDAREILGKSQQFQRKGDNTIYHKGYPLNYRGSGGVPSVQISIARETDRADIDVDYRSSKFPVSLFNGHLSSSNSDVRAGNNHDRHVSQWGGGLEDWWRGLFGLAAASGEEPAEVSGEIIPAEPPAGKGKLEDAVYDFLNSWLVEGRPNVAVSYMSERSYECLQLGQEEPIDHGMAPFIFLKGMADAKRAIGPKASLEEATVGVRLVDPSLRLIENPHHAQFVLYEIAEDVASSFECINRTAVVSEASESGSRRFGKYYGSILYIEGPGRGDTLALLWEKENGVWKIVSYEVEPLGEDPDTPDLRPTETAETVEIKRMDGDARLISVTEDFVRSWLVDKNIDQAFGHLSQRAYSCYNLFRADDAPEAQSSEEAGQHIREGMEELSQQLPDVSSLEQIIESVDVTNPAIFLVSHPNESAYTLIAAPDEIAEAFDCAARARGEEFTSEGIASLGYGSYFATGFQFNVEQGEGAALVLAWVQEDGQWKIYAYDVQTP